MPIFVLKVYQTPSLGLKIFSWRTYLAVRASVGGAMPCRYSRQNPNAKVTSNWYRDTLCRRLPRNEDCSLPGATIQRAVKRRRHEHMALVFARSHKVGGNKWSILDRDLCDVHASFLGIENAS
jgi:hypothetical protein